MPGFVVTLANQVLCTHGGKATPVPPVGRVVASGFGVFTLAHRYVVTGCLFPAMTLGVQPPCVVGTVNIGTTRVFSLGIPIAILPNSALLSQGLPNPTPLIFIPAGQIRVSAI